MKSRPEAAEVVTHLKKAAGNWVGLMPPYIWSDDVPSDPKEPTSDSMQHCGLEVSIFLWYRPSNNSAGGIFQPSSGAAPTSPTQSQATAGPSSHPSTSPTQYINAPTEEPSEAITNSSCIPEVYPWLNQHYGATPFQPSQKKRKGFTDRLLSRLGMSRVRVNRST